MHSEIATLASGSDITPDGKLFNLRLLLAVTKVKETVIRDFLFVDDCALNARNKRFNWKLTGSPQPVITSVYQSALKKTEVMFQPAPSNPYQEPIITVKGEKLQAVENFTYLGITLSNNIISKVSSAFGRLRKTFWERRGIHLAT